MALRLLTQQRCRLWAGRHITNFSSNNFHTAIPKSLAQVTAAKDNSVGNENVDFSSAIEDFRKNGMAVLPLKIEPAFVKKSKEICFSAYEDALKRAEIIRGHEMKVGMEYGFQEFVARAPGRYDMHWMVNGEKHFLDEENVLSKFMPFVHGILGKFKLFGTAHYLCKII